MLLERFTQEKLSLCRRLKKNLRGINQTLELLEREGENAEQMAFFRLDADLASRKKLLDACARCESRIDSAREKNEPATPEYEALEQTLEREGAELAALDRECSMRFERLRADMMDKLRENNQHMKGIRAYKLDRNDYIATAASRINVNI